MNVLWSLMTFAADKIDPGSIGITKPVKDANSLLSGLLNAAYLGAGILCVVIIVIAGYIYVTSSGDASSVKRAKDAILGAVIGIIVIIMAFAITQFVIGRF